MKRRVVLGTAAVAAGVVIGAAVRQTRRRAGHDGDDHRPADVGFMLAMHAAFRRDVDRLREATGFGDPASRGVRAGWDLFRRELLNHHEAEDEDLWPVLRSKVSKKKDLATIDAMYDEHGRLPAALGAVDALIDGGGERHSVDELADLVLKHLDHEEQEALPLVRAHLSDAEWHRFLITERQKRPPRQRAEFLAWVLDDASDDVAEPVLREIPKPGQFVYRTVLRRIYD